MFVPKEGDKKRKTENAFIMRKAPKGVGAHKYYFLSVYPEKPREL